MHKRSIISGLLAILFFAGILFPGQSRASAQNAQTVRVEGWLSTVWGDAQDGAPAPTSYTLTDDNGQALKISMDESLLSAAGGIAALDRKRVSAEIETGGAELSALAEGRASALRVKQIGLAESISAAAQPEITGAQPWVTIMCKFKDITAAPKGYNYFVNMYGNTYPRLNHYWQEVSYNNININGSAVAGNGWYILPQPRSYYIYNGALDHTRATNDCIAKANSVIDFKNYVGINLMFNDELDGYAWGGSRYMTLDGATRTWYMTWEPPWGYSNITVMSHEMGHGFGLPHSSGMYGQTYDNAWDVMSSAWYNCISDATFGCLGQHTISYHKNKLGWILPSQRYVPAKGTSQVITIDHLALASTSNYRMAQIPVTSTTFYTVEVRQPSGYDSKLPTKAVIIHKVNTANHIPAQVVDVDKDGDTSDEGAQWVVGETFTDSGNGVSITVESETTDGFNVRVTLGKKMTFYSIGGDDGAILESGENTGVGGSIKASTLVFELGDNAMNKQYRAILSFDTSTLPAGAVVMGATLKIKPQSVVGTSPFSTHGNLLINVCNGTFLGNRALQKNDFQATCGGNLGYLSKTPSGGWHAKVLGSTVIPYINLSGLTQIRLRFAKDDNNNLLANYVRFHSGNAIISNRPFLNVIYYIP